MTNPVEKLKKDMLNTLIKGLTNNLGKTTRGEPSDENTLAGFGVLGMHSPKVLAKIIMNTINPDINRNIKGMVIIPEKDLLTENELKLIRGWIGTCYCDICHKIWRKLKALTLKEKT
jgi:hypothetical protein